MPEEPLAHPLLYPLIKQQTRNREDRKMRADGQTIRGNEMDMGKVRDWVKRTFSKERIAGAIAGLVFAGYVGIFLAQVIQVY